MTRPLHVGLLLLCNSHATAHHGQPRLGSISDDRPGHSDRSRGGFDHGPTDDHVVRVLALRPSSLQKTVDHHGVVQSIEPPHTVVESNSRHAICNAFPRDTNSRQPTRTQALAVSAELEPHGVVAAVQS